MADKPHDSTKVGDPNPKTNPQAATSTSTEAAAHAEPAEETLLSLEDLDAVISADDPDFSGVIGGIGPNEEMIANAIGEFGLEYTLADEESLWKHSGGWRTLVYKMLPFVPRINFKLRQLRIGVRERIIHFKVVLKLAGPATLKWILAHLKAAKHTVSEAMRSFRYFSAAKKATFFGLLLLLGLTGFVIYRSATKGLFPEPEEMFVGTLQDWAQEIATYDPATETESFYDSTHSSQNMMVLPKMVVNLKRSPNSGVNPMGAFEFYIEGSASEVVVEVKDREAEVTDLFQRNLEEMTFDQVSSGEGKQLLCEKLRKEVNRILTKGKARRIFIKTAIVKP